MITLTMATIEGAAGATLADMDGETVRLSTLLGGPSDAWNAAEYLRDVYREVIRSAGAVTLSAHIDRGIVTGGVEWVAA